MAVELFLGAALGQYQARAAWAFFRVSRVPKDLEETMNRVVSAFRRLASSWNSLPSMFAR